LSIYNIQTTWLQNTCQCKGSWIQLQKKKTKPLFLSTLCSCRGKTLVDSQEHKFDMLSGDESSNLSIDSANPTPISGVSREHWTRFKDATVEWSSCHWWDSLGFLRRPTSHRVILSQTKHFSFLFGTDWVIKLGPLF